jgi:dienelactone hydrolase
VNSAAERWTLRSLLAATCVPEGQVTPPSDVNACADRLLREIKESRPEAHVQASILDSPLESSISVPQRSGAWPVVVLDAGMRSDALAYFSLAEFIASHGFIVISMPSIPYAPGRDFGFNGNGVRSKADSITAVLDAAAQWSGSDASRVLLAAWSVGGVSTAAVAARDQRVRAVLSLDGGLGYDYGSKLLSEINVVAIDKPILHITGAMPNPYPVPKSDELFARVGAPSWVAIVQGVNHSHFVMQGGVVPYARDVSSDGERFRRAYRSIAMLSLRFAEGSLLDRRDSQAALHTLATMMGADVAITQRR